MNALMKKSVLLVVLLKAGITSGFEEQKTVRVGDPSTGTFTIEIPEDGVSRSSVSGVGIEQTADKLAKIITCFNNARVKKQTTEFFQGQTTDALLAFNCAAKISLQEPLGNGIDTAATKTFTQSVVDALEKKHESRCVELQQQRAQELKKFKRDVCKNQCAFMGIGSLVTTFACGMVILTSLGGRC